MVSIKKIIESCRKEKIVANTILVYIEIENIRKEGFWLWSIDLGKIKKFLYRALSEFHKQLVKKDNNVLEILDSIKKISTLKEARTIIHKINAFAVNNAFINKRYKIYIYRSIEEAIKKVIKNNSNIYINLNKTFKEDDYCLKDY